MFWLSYVLLKNEKEKLRTSVRACMGTAKIFYHFGLIFHPLLGHSHTT